MLFLRNCWKTTLWIRSGSECGNNSIIWICVYKNIKRVMVGIVYYIICIYLDKVHTILFFRIQKVSPSLDKTWWNYDPSYPQFHLEILTTGVFMGPWIYRQFRCYWHGMWNCFKDLGLCTQFAYQVLLAFIEPLHRSLSASKANSNNSRVARWWLQHILKRMFGKFRAFGVNALRMYIPR